VPLESGSIVKKYLAWFTLLLLLSGVVNFKHEQYADKAAANRGNKCLLVFLDCASDSKSDPTESKDNQEIWWGRGYIFFGWPNGITIWALFLTMFVIAEQTIETRRAANAQVDGNRAWIFADLEKLGGRIHSSGSEEGYPKTYLMLRLNLSNQGLSPAWIESIQAHMEILPRKQIPPKKVEFMSFPYRPTIMVKGADVINPDLECSGNLTRETDDLFIWVVIRYHDGHGIQGETSLGYGMNLSGTLFRQNNIPQRNYNK